MPDRRTATAPGVVEVAGSQDGAPEVRAPGGRLDEITMAALRQIYERGYHAVSLRDVSAEVGMHVSSLYNYFSSKHELLSTITLRALDAFEDAVYTAIDQHTGPADKLRALMEADIFFHLENPELANVITTEHRSLVVGPARDEIRKRIKEFERRVMDILDEGQQAGEMIVPDLKMAAYLITTCCARTVAWYKPGGRLSREQIAGMFSSMLLRSVLAR